jgi:hypothetical protein
MTVAPNRIGVADYSSEAPLKEADRKEQERRAKARKRTLYALTVVCRDEADQKALFPQARRLFAGRRIRVVVS